MKTAIPVTRNYKPFEVSEKFSKSPYFLVIDSESQTFSYFLNPYFDASADQGIRVVEFLAESDIKQFVALEYSIQIQLVAKKYEIQLIRLNNFMMNVPQILALMNLANATEQFTNDIPNFNF